MTMLTRENYINSSVEIEHELLHFYQRTDKLIVFDIGACEAEDSIRYANLFPASTVYAFEPRQDNFSKGKELIMQYKKSNIIFENIALSNQDGTSVFYLSSGEPAALKNDDHWDYGNKSSSLLPPADEMKQHIEWLKFNEKIEVATKRLDHYMTEKKIDQIDLMHLDVQGAELLVLEGAGEFMKKIGMIWTEVESVSLYKDQPLKKDVEQFMLKNGFINILDTVGSVSGDQLYVSSAFFNENKIKSYKPRRKSRSFFTRLKDFIK